MKWVTLDETATSHTYELRVGFGKGPHPWAWSIWNSQGKFEAQGSADSQASARRAAREAAKAAKQAAELAEAVTAVEAKLLPPRADHELGLPTPKGEP